MVPSFYGLELVLKSCVVMETAVLELTCDISIKPFLIDLSVALQWRLLRFHTGS